MNKLKEILFIHRQKLISAATIIVVIIALINIYMVLEVRVNSNDECLWTPKKVSPDSTAIIFEFVKEDGVTWNAGIRDGDQLLKINGIPVRSPNQAQGILNRVDEGEFARYEVLHNGKILETKVYIKKLIQFPILATALLGLFWVLIGYVVLSAKPDGTNQKIFYGIGVATVFSMLQVWLPAGFSPSQLHDNPLYYIIIAYFLTLGSAFLPFLIIYFFFNYPRQFKFLQRKWIHTLIFIIPSILFILTFVFTISYFAFNYGYNINFNIFGGLYGLANIVGWISLIIHYKRLDTLDEKRPIFIILVAYTIGIAATIYTSTVAPALTDIIYNNPEYYTPIILIALVPIAFAYSIFKYHLMDVSVVIKNTIIYGAATLTIAVIYFIVIYLLGQTISQAIGTEYQGLIAGAAFVIFALIFQSTKDKFQDFITASMYPEQFGHQKVLIRFSNEVTTIVGLENILDSMKETFVDGLKIKNLGIMIRDEKDVNYKLVRSVGFTGNDIVIKDNHLMKFIRDNFLIKDKVFIEQEKFDEVFPDQSQRLKNENIFTIIPMIIKSKVVGLLLFGLKYSGSKFAGKDLDLLNAVANQAAISIENARLYQSEAEKLKLERDLDIARKIQQGLLPKFIPDIKGLDICGRMIPAMQVGGDYFDLIPVDDKKIFVVVGDVSGKGLGASLYMTKLQTMIQLACSADRSPKEILVEVNKRFYASIDRDKFITMTLALFDMEKNIVTFCRAGHMPIYAAMNGKLNEYRTKGLGVGLEKGVIFENTLVEETADLKNGEIFAFFSDGITEAMNEKDELFGEENLSQLLINRTGQQTSEIIEDIWKSVHTFRGTAEINDDMTMVLVRVEG